MGDTELGKLEFLAAFQEFRNKTFKSSTIRHAFRTTGIVPFNPNMVLDVIRQKQAAALEIMNEPRTPSPHFFNLMSASLEALNQSENSVTNCKGH